MVVDASDRRQQQQRINRWVLIGASNVAVSLPRIVRLIRQFDPSPQQILIVAGHGRTLTRDSYFLARKLPGALESGLWPKWDQLPEADRQVGLITDIGNDLVHGRHPEQVLRSVQQTADRLMHRCQAVAYTALPLASLRATPRWRFQLAKSLFFPGSSLRFTDALDRACELDAMLKHWSEQVDSPPLHRIEPERRWYGWDPIHLKPQCADQAWKAILGTLAAPTPTGVHNGAEQSLTQPSPRTAHRRWLESFRLSLCAAERRTLCGVPITTSQPVFRWPDGGDLWLF